MSDSTHTVRLHRVLRAPAERVYRAFLDPDAMAKWLPPHGFTGKVHQSDARVGGGYRMSFTNFSSGKTHVFGGTYVELTPHERIRYTDTFEDPHLPGEMHVAITLRPVACGTDLAHRAGRPSGGDSGRDVLPRMAGVAAATGRPGRSGDSRRRVARPRSVGWHTYALVVEANRAGSNRATGSLTPVSTFADLMPSPCL